MSLPSSRRGIHLMRRRMVPRARVQSCKVALESCLLGWQCCSCSRCRQRASGVQAARWPPWESPQSARPSHFLPRRLPMQTSLSQQLPNAKRSRRALQTSPSQQLPNAERPRRALRRLRQSPEMRRFRGVPGRPGRPRAALEVVSLWAPSSADGRGGLREQETLPCLSRRTSASLVSTPPRLRMTI